MNVEGTLIKKHYQDLLKETLQKCKARNIKKAVPQAYLELDSLNKLTRNGQVCSFSNRNSLEKQALSVREEQSQILQQVQVREMEL